MLLEIETIEGETHNVECDGACWDADGTLYRGYEGGPVEEARREALSNFGLIAPPNDRLRGFAGEEVLAIVRKFQPPEAQRSVGNMWPSILAESRRILVLPKEFTVLEDAAALAQAFLEGGVPQAVVTNSTLESWNEKRKRVLGWPEGILEVVTMTCVRGQPKPKPHMLHEAARRIEAQKPILFGDSKPDAMAAQNAGWRCVIRADGRAPEQLKYIQKYGAWVVEDFSRVKVRSNFNRPAS